MSIASHRFCRAQCWITVAAISLIFIGARQLANAQTAQPQAAPKQKANIPPRQPNQPAQKTFSSAQEAVSALYRAARANDENEMLAILGPGAHDIIMWTDDPADRKTDVDMFVSKYDQMHRLVKEPDHETTLYVGAENWPLPIPLIEEHALWHFDAALGRQEILYRRIGENEMNGIDVLRALAEAENEYYDTNSGSTPEYASRIMSDQGKRDGLYWPASGNDDASLVGPYVAAASYNRSDRKPLHGYYVRMLMEQGPAAPGGARKYVVNSGMTGGFAFVAFPAEYRSSGVKTFIVGQDGIVYEKDLGPGTTKIASSMTAFNPDKSWTRMP